MSRWGIYAAVHHRRTTIDICFARESGGNSVLPRNGAMGHKPILQLTQSPRQRAAISAQPSMAADELRRQADVFIDLAQLKDKIGRDPSERTAPRVPRDLGQQQGKARRSTFQALSKATEAGPRSPATLPVALPLAPKQGSSPLSKAN
jgi:hypothetical protein